MVEGRLGSPPLAAKRDQFALLVARGIGSAEACRMVGVHPKTRKRWRRGRVMITSGGKTLHYAPVIDTRRQVISQRYLSEDDRVAIADLAGAGLGVRATAARLGRSRRRSVGSCAVTGIRAAECTGRSPRSCGRPGGVPGPAAAGCYAIRCCASSWQAGWRCGGARSRSATRCRPSFPATRDGSWSTRRSTRRPAGRSWAAGCARTRVGCCAPGAGTASGTGVVMPAGPGY